MEELNVFTESRIMDVLVGGKPFRSNHYSFFLLKEGTATVRFDFKDYELSANCVLIITHGTNCELLTISGNAKFFLINVEKNFQPRTSIKLSRLGIWKYISPPPSLHLHFSEDEFNEIWQLAHIMQVKIEDQKELRFQKDMVHNLFTVIVYLIEEGLNRKSFLTNASQAQREKMTVEFIHLLDIHSEKNHSVSFYADLLGITPKHLSETLKLVTGHTATELINTALIVEAKVLLHDEHLRVRQIAEKLNFSDQYSFSKFFKRLTGMSPSKYIRKVTS